MNSVGRLSTNLSSNLSKLPCPLTLCRLGDFDNEPDDANDIVRSVGTEDRYSLGVHPARAAVAVHNTEFTHPLDGTIGPEHLHRDFAKSAPIVWMHALQEQMKVCWRMARNSEDMPQLI